MESQKHRVTIRISGKVQGVWFRASTKQKAQELNLTGWVRNEPDGSVAAEAEGGKVDLQTFIDWCHVGSPAAEVDRVDVEWKEPEGYSSFEIKL